MRIYFSGVGGVGIGPLMEIARDAGYDVVGSDSTASHMTEQLAETGFNIQIGQDGSQISAAHLSSPIEWFCHTSALPENHPELVFAREHGIRTSKRDELLAEILREKNLKLIAVAGTHGKTSVTSMFIWAFKQLGILVSYSVGTTLSFGPSGQYVKDSEYFIYECDEFDRNFLHFSPSLSVLPSIDYDHADTYPTPDDYHQAFVQFMQQSELNLLWEKDLQHLLQPDIAANYEAYDELMDLTVFTLAGNHVRHNAYLVKQAIVKLFLDLDEQAVISALNSFPGSMRRFEKLADNLYSDYGHHPVEIDATLELARELSDHVVLVYQPHQNRRQYELRDAYSSQFTRAEKIYWVPTYLSREDPNQPVLNPEELSKNLTNREAVEIAELNDRLWDKLQDARTNGKLVLCMGAGDIDAWVRQQLTKQV